MPRGGVVQFGVKLGNGGGVAECGRGISYHVAQILHGFGVSRFGGQRQEVFRFVRLRFYSAASFIENLAQSHHGSYMLLFSCGTVPFNRFRVIGVFGFVHEIVVTQLILCFGVVVARRIT